MSKKISTQKAKARKKERERITIFLDSDILDFFKTRAAQPDSPKYQAQINNELRKVVEANEQANRSGLSSSESSMLENEVFIKALKEKMKNI